MLAAALWQVVRLDALGGIDPSTVNRYRLALRAGADVSATMESIAEYRRALVLGASPMSLNALRNVLDARMKSLDLMFGPSGAASSLDTENDWATSQKAWAVLRNAPPGPSAMPLFSPLTNGMVSLLNDCDNGSGWNYDSNAASQNLSFVWFGQVPDAYEDVSRSWVQSELAVRRGGMPLKDRLIFSSTLGGVRNWFDLSGDNVPTYAATLGQLMPEHAKEFATLGPLADRYASTGTAYYKLLHDNVLYEDRPTLDPARIAATALPALRASRVLGYQISFALSELIAQRAQVYNTRKIYIYAVILIGAL
ncbi:MAG: hypothetical protein JO199_07615, partial [Candidatus Eremiobacteraeota bacterium]|nr:hypothetical protein [Candidatus Eremiobacteraeota bacterium]